MLAAHVVVMIKPPFPDTLLSDLLVDSYPTLVSHAERILSRSKEFPAPNNSSRGHSIWSLFPSLAGKVGERVEKSEDDIHHERMSWGWISLAVGSVSLYLITMGSPVRLRDVEVDST